MPSNAELIHHFYTAFQNKNYKAMQECYDEDAVFSDEVFKGLDSKQTRAMWEMLLVRSKDLVLKFENIVADDIHGSAEWLATYTFSKSGRKVTNKIKAHFIFSNNRIIQHIDKFDFYGWARQALGMTGILLGWTSYLKKRVQKSAMKSLEEYIIKNNISSS